MENTDAKIEGFNIKTISKDLMLQGYTKRIECRNFQFIKGEKVTCELTPYTFNSQVKFEIYKETRKYSSRYTPTRTDETYLVYINNELFDVGKVTGFRELKTKLILEVYMR